MIGMPRLEISSPLLHPLYPGECCHPCSPADVSLIGTGSGAGDSPEQAAAPIRFCQVCRDFRDYQNWGDFLLEGGGDACRSKA